MKHIELSPKSVKGKVRVGRGIGSSRGGHTVGRGQKGQKSRSGYNSPRPGFEGGRMPLSRRIPKLRGFKRSFFDARIARVIITLDQIQKNFNDGEIVNYASIQEKKIGEKISKNVKFKILNKGEILKKVIIDGIAISESAKEKVLKLGGEVK